MAWLLAATLVTVSALIATRTMWKHGGDAEWLTEPFPALALAVSVLAFSAASSAARARALKEIFALLPQNDKGKAVLFGTHPPGGLRPASLATRDVMAALAVRLDRAASVAKHEGAIEALLERYWDWYFVLFALHDLDQVRQDKRDAMMQLLDQKAKPSGLPGPDPNRFWLRNLYEIRPIVLAYAKRHFGLELNERGAGAGL